MQNQYLAVLDNNEKPRVFIIRLDKGEDEEQVANALGLNLDKCEWMAGGMGISINI